MPRGCKNCNEPVHTPDDRTGLIHINGKYICNKFKTSRSAGITSAE